MCILGHHDLTLSLAVEEWATVTKHDEARLLRSC